MTISFIGGMIVKNPSTGGDKMEGGDLSLEESLKYFERGMLLTKNCQQALNKAEQKVRILLEKNNKNNLESFGSDNSD